MGKEAISHGSHSRSNKSGKREYGSKWLLLCRSNTVMNGRFVVVQVVTHLCAGGGAKKLVNIGMEVLIAVTVKTQVSFGMEESNARFILKDFIMTGDGRWCHAMVKGFQVFLPEFQLLLPHDRQEACEVIYTIRCCLRVIAPIMRDIKACPGLWPKTLEYCLSSQIELRRDGFLFFCGKSIGQGCRGVCQGGVEAV